MFSSTSGSSEKEPLTIVVQLTGGMANQLFQWGTAWLLSKQYGALLHVDCRVVDRPDGRGNQLKFMNLPVDSWIEMKSVEARFWQAVRKILPRVGIGALKRVRALSFKITRKRVVSNLATAHSHLSESRSIRMEGLFQEVDFLYSRRSDFRLVFGSWLSAKASTHQGRYSAVHIRRGDYVSNSKYSRLFGNCSDAYYLQGISKLPAAHPVLLVSDDSVWTNDFVSANQSTGQSFEIAEGDDHFSDFATLAGASSLVLSNSTFSWWAAFIGNAEDVYCPTPWFTDPSRDQGLARPEWTKLAR